ncbi:MAG TPA: ATP synthase F1 subunit gamma [Firmicutes bacterium]|nr:ATP synthase F1 subunit gamma [Bacillota bacterium]
MAQSAREIKRRISSIASTQQITKAMEMIAAVKLRKAQAEVLNTRPFFQRLGASLAAVIEAAHKAGDPLPEIARSRPGKKHCLILFTSDRGLAGGYNAAIIREAEAFLRKHPDTELVILGRKARDHFRRRSQTFLAEFINLGDEPTLRQAQEIGQVVYDFYAHELFDRVTILYTKFINTVTHKAEYRHILPVVRPEADQKTAAEMLNALYIYEPSINAVLEALLPLYVDAAVYQSLVEAKASEFGARMTAMRNASDNADELIRELNLTFHRARQAMITKEIAEIVGGADALEA